MKHVSGAFICLFFVFAEKQQSSRTSCCRGISVFKIKFVVSILSFEKNFSLATVLDICEKQVINFTSAIASLQQIDLCSGNVVFDDWLSKSYDRTHS